MTTQEQWLPVPGYEGLYEASNMGRIKALRYGRLMSPGSNKDGYPIVSFYKDGRREGKAVHRLIGEMFVSGREPHHTDVAHLDGTRTNARADNLMWTTRAENNSHKKGHGTLLFGVGHPRAKLKDDDVREIMQARGSIAGTRLAARFGTSSSTIYDIWAGRLWGHLFGSEAA